MSLSLLGILLGGPGGDCGPKDGVDGFGVGGYTPYGDGGSVPPCCVANTEGEGSPRPAYAPPFRLAASTPEGNALGGAVPCAGVCTFEYGV